MSAWKPAVLYQGLAFYTKDSHPILIADISYLEVWGESMRRL